jgi:hypothetical protein
MVLSSKCAPAWRATGLPLALERRSAISLDARSQSWKGLKKPLREEWPELFQRKPDIEKKAAA